MRKNVKIAVTLCAMCMLIMGTTTNTAAALTSTKASIAIQTTYAKSDDQVLEGRELNGTVESTNYLSPAAYRLTGRMQTHGSVFHHTRDVAYVTGGNSESLHWDNETKITGYYYAEAEAEYANHDGYCYVYQA